MKLTPLTTITANTQPTNNPTVFSIHKGTGERYYFKETRGTTVVTFGVLPGDQAHAEKLLARRVAVWRRYNPTT